MVASTPPIPPAPTGQQASFLNFLQVIQHPHVLTPQTLQMLLQFNQMQRNHGTLQLDSPVPSDSSTFSGFKHTSTPAARPNDSLGVSLLTPSTFDSSSNPAANLSFSGFQTSTPLSTINAHGGNGGKIRRNRPRGQTMKTALVWEFFEQRPDGEQAATCKIETCKKIIKATNSSTTGMIRHLRSCHRDEHEQLEEAKRQKQFKQAYQQYGHLISGPEMRRKISEIISAHNEAGLAPFITSDGHSSPPHQSPSAASPHSTSSIDHTASSSSSVAALSTRDPQKSTGLHSINSLLRAEVTDESVKVAPLTSGVFDTPNKYMKNFQRNLQQVEENAKKTAAAVLLHEEEETSGDEHKEGEENDETDESDPSIVSVEEATQCWSRFMKFMGQMADEETLKKLDQIDEIFQQLRKRSHPQQSEIPHHFN